MVAFILLLGLIVWGILSLVRRVKEFDDDAQHKAEQRKIVEVEESNYDDGIDDAVHSTHLGEHFDPER